MLPEALAALRGPYLVPALALTLLAYLATSYATAWYRLRAFPGPRLASLSYFWMLRICRSGKQAARYEHINQRYGRVARIGPNDLITDDPGLVRRMGGARSAYRRSSWYTAVRMDPYDEGLFSLTDTAAHDRLKAKLSFGYGGKENPALERDVDEQLAGLVAHIRRKYVSDEERTRPFDLALAAQYFTMDAITKIAYGKEFGFLAADADVFHAIEGAEEGIPFLVVLAEMPFLGRLFTKPWVLKLLGPKKTDAKGLGRMLGIAEEVVAKRFGPDAKDQRDMLGAFIRHGVSQRECEIEVPFQLVAGSDTTATAIRGTMLHLAATRHAYAKLQKEIDTAVAEGRVSNPITGEEGKKLEYLQAVIYEGLRMQVPFSGLVMKEVPPEGDTIDGRFVPGGTRIAHNTLGIQRRRDIFGEDADVFRPERWLGISPDKRQLMVQTTELVFGYGRWGCSGKPVAFLELNKVFVELLRRFDFEILHPKRPWREANYNMFFQSELWMRVTERSAARGE
ncbi:hypothetical protein VTK56DRAFT_5467 [Thermocarpiscus australiensis]